MENLPVNYLPKEGVVSLYTEERFPGYTASSVHSHDHEELLLVLSGCRFQLESNGFRFTVSGPAVILHRSGSFHEIVSVAEEGVCRCCVVFFRMDPAIRKIPLFQKQWDLAFMECGAEDIRLLKEYYDLMDGSEREERNCLLRAALLRTDSLSSVRHMTFHYPRERYLFALVHYLADHYAEKNTLEDIAREFHVSSGKLKRDFTHITGMTVKQYLTELRFRRAAEFLKEGKSLSDIANETGFSGESHFIAAFRKRFGVTPGSFRKQEQKQE